MSLATTCMFQGLSSECGCQGRWPADPSWRPPSLVQKTPCRRRQNKDMPSRLAVCLGPLVRPSRGRRHHAVGHVLPQAPAIGDALSHAPLPQPLPIISASDQRRKGSSSRPGPCPSPCQLSPVYPCSFTWGREMDWDMR
jgi:hypothetical protein